MQVLTRALATTRRRLPPPHHRVRRAVIGSAAVAVLVAVSAGVASAHVEVTSSDAAPGGEGTVTFTVPNETEHANTVAVTVLLPIDPPFAEVSVQAKPGWQIRQTTVTLAKPAQVGGFTLTKAVHTVTWTATTGPGIEPGQYDEFGLSLGPFPESGGSVTFPTVQTYDDGTVVRWNQPTPADGTEPAHPAPALALGAGGSEHQSTSADDAEPASTSNGSIALAAGGLVLGAVGTVLGALALRRTRAVT